MSPKISEEERRAGDRERQRRSRARRKAREVLGIEGPKGRAGPGNDRAEVTHGIRSPERVDARAAEVARDLMGDPSTPDYLRDPGWRRAVEAWAHAEAICVMLREWLAGVDVTTAMSESLYSDEKESMTGVAGNQRVSRVTVSRRVSSVLDQLHRHETRAMKLRSELGLSPLSRARLGKDAAAEKFDLARYWAELDRAEKAAVSAPGQPDAETGQRAAITA